MTMPGYLILAAGFLLGILATRTAMVLSEYLPSRPVEQTTQPQAQNPRRYGAGDILGYYQGGLWVAPTHPATRGAQNSMQARIAWDGRRRNAA